jgi:hypothetical protein
LKAEIEGSLSSPASEIVEEIGSHNMGESRQKSEQEAVRLIQGTSAIVVGVVARGILKTTLRRSWIAAQQRKYAFTWQTRAAEPKAL